MARSVLLLLVGAMVGGAAVYVFFQPAANPGAPFIAGPIEELPALPASAPAVDSNAAGNTAADPGQLTAIRIAAYQQAAQATDVIDLESMLDFAQARPKSRARDLELKALLGRLAEIDPLRAVDFAQSAYLETPLLAQAFEALARADSDAAIIRLASVTPAAKQRSIALAVLRVVGNDEQGVARLAAALPVEDETSFRIDALLARAESDPLGAFREMISLERATLQSLMLPRLADIVARRDPKGALSLAESIDDPDLRRSFQFSVLNAWSETNPEAVFEFLETADPMLLSASTTIFRSIARSDPDRLLAMIDRFPPSARNNAKSAVMQSIAERDPVEAIAMLDTIPPGQERERMIQVIAQAYGRENPDLAMAWVKSLTPQSENAMRAVLQGIAQTDVDRAIDLMLAELDQQGQGAGAFGNPASFASTFSFSLMLSMMSNNGADVSRLADRLLDTDSPRVVSMMSSVVSMWAQRDSEAALTWALANADRLDDSALRNMSQGVARENLDLAMSTLERLPTDKRAGWIEGLAAQMVQQDVEQAISFLERYRGQPGFDQAYSSVLSQIARNDPVRAAGMLRNAPQANNMSAIFAISREWANRDPAAAGRWAMESITDAQLQSTAISNIASTWAQRDGEAAERWIFSLSSGEARDAAARGYLAAAAQVGQFQPRLLEAFSSDEAAQQGASNAIVQLGRTDPDEAKRLLTLYVTDPAIRAQAEANLARSNATVSGSGIVILNGNIISLN